MARFDKATLYFSDLRKEDDPITIKMLSDEPQPGKYKKDQLQHHFECEGKSHFLIVDSDAMGAALSGYKGKILTIRAVGGKGEEDIEIVSEGAPAARQTRTSTQPPAKSTGAPQKNHAAPAGDAQKAFHGAKVYMAQVSVLMEMALKASAAVCARALPNATTEDVRTVAATIFIESKSMVQIMNLPVKYPDASNPPPKPPPEPEPEPEPAAEDLSDQEIPF